MSEQPISASVRARVAWGDVESLPVVAASHFLIQAAIHDVPHVNDVILTLGYLAPPVILGTPEEQLAAAVRVTEVQVTPTARFIMSLAKVGELVQGLTQMIEIVEANRQQDQP